MNLGHWLSNAVSTAGKAVGSMAPYVREASGVVATVAAIDPDLAKQLNVPPEVIEAAKGFAATGSVLVAASPVLSAAVQSLPPGAGRDGFSIAVQLLQKPVSQVVIERVRASLPPAARLPFDMGVSAHIGQVAHVPPPAPPPVQAAYLITKGVQGATPSQKAAIVGVLAANSDTRPGAAMAIKEVAAAREGWFGRFMHWLGLKP